VKPMAESSKPKKWTRGGTKDTVPAMLAEGEAVLNKAAAEKMGRGKIAEANRDGAKRMGLHGKGKKSRHYAEGTDKVADSVKAEIYKNPGNVPSLRNPATNDVNIDEDAQGIHIWDKEGKSGWYGRPGRDRSANQAYPDVDRQFGIDTPDHKDSDYPVPKRENNPPRGSGGGNNKSNLGGRKKSPLYDKDKD